MQFDGPTDEAVMNFAGMSYSPKSTSRMFTSSITENMTRFPMSVYQSDPGSSHGSFCCHREIASNDFMASDLLLRGGSP